jgi:hypothetical protein
MSNQVKKGRIMVAQETIKNQKNSFTKENTKNLIKMDYSSGVNIRLALIH